MTNAHYFDGVPQPAVLALAVGKDFDGDIGRDRQVHCISSSTSRYDNPYRRYQRTATAITSRGNRKPANADELQVVTRPVS